jgi:hypothetical protein
MSKQDREDLFAVLKNIVQNRGLNAVPVD